MKIQEGDFIKIDYVAKVKQDSHIFDTTKKEVADEEGLEYDANAQFEPMIVCIGQNQVLAGLEKNLIGKDEGSYTFELKPEEAFGKKRADLLKLIPMKEFTRKEVKPFPGLELNIDGKRGTVRTVSGGRVIVDFNHPLSSKDIVYEVDVLEKVTDKKLQLESFLEMSGLAYKNVEVKKDKAVIEFNQELPKQITDKLEEEIGSVVNLKIQIGKKENSDTKQKDTKKKTEKKENNK